jgi:predicted glycosyltransferase involved in capsule biosynthesis
MTDFEPPRITIVTTCRGRLAHLKQSLPRFAAQAQASCVVVDYGCPENCGDWVEQNFPAVRVARSGPTAYFEVARARNLGAAAAETEWLAFLGADALIDADFMKTVLPSVEAGTFYVTQPRDGSYVGQCLIPRAAFHAVGGYDAVLQGWGMDDKDLFTRRSSTG